MAESLRAATPSRPSSDTKNATFSRRRATRAGSASRTSSAARAAAIAGAPGAVEKMNGRDTFRR